MQPPCFSPATDPVAFSQFRRQRPLQGQYTKVRPNSLLAQGSAMPGTPTLPLPETQSARQALQSVRTEAAPQQQFSSVAEKCQQLSEKIQSRLAQRSRVSQ